MPNWTSNSIYAEGSPQQISEFLEAIRGEDSVIDFNRIIPMPEILKNTASGSHTFHGEEHHSWYVARPENLRDRGDRPFTPEEQAALRDIGYTNWYDWRGRHWGVKWNASDPKIVSGGKPDSYYVRIEFDTPWDAPIPVLRKLREMFPALDITCKWRHEDEDPYPHSLDDLDAA